MFSAPTPGYRFRGRRFHAVSQSAVTAVTEGEPAVTRAEEELGRTEEIDASASATRGGEFFLKKPGFKSFSKNVIVATAPSHAATCELLLYTGDTAVKHKVRQ